MKPENNPDLSEAVSDVIQEAGRLNHQMREGHLHEVLNSLYRIERKAWQASCMIVDIADLAG